MSTEAVVFENPLRDAHAVARGEACLFVTEDGCLRGSQGLRRLVSALPRRGTEREFREALAGAARDGAFEALVASGALKEAEVRPFGRRLADALLRPRLRLLGPGLQERLFAGLGLTVGLGEGRLFAVNAAAAGLGLALSLAAWLGGAASEGALAPTVALVLAGMMVHELGHSASAWLLGLGARPIGAALYLFCPVLYTNVSGIRTLGLRGRLAVSLGGFAAQTAFMAVLALIAAFAHGGSAGRACTVLGWLLLFNLNPLLHTDGYWCLQDAYDFFRDRPWAGTARALYLGTFTAYTAYLAWLGASMLHRAAAQALAGGGPSPESLGRLLLAAYVAALLAQGVRGRIDEVRRAS